MNVGMAPTLKPSGFALPRTSAARLNPRCPKPWLQHRHPAPSHEGRYTATHATRNPKAFLTASGTVDYYEVLGVHDDASPAEIKAAYRALAKVCHPDFAGDSGHDMCVLLNEAYEVLSNGQSRSLFNQRLQQALQDEEEGYTGEPLSKWCANGRMGKNADPAENRAVFVDELTCIGCKNCVWEAPATFRIEPAYGRSRVFAQWVDKEDNLQAAIDSCPVSCIHWVNKEDLAGLEYVTQYKLGRTGVAAMMAGQGGGGDDVFDATARFLKRRKSKEEEAAKSKVYSPAQEAARQEAADALRKKQMGWFYSFSSFSSYVMSYTNPTTGPTDTSRVGTRRRSRTWRDAEQAKVRGGTIPLERSLVPITVYDKER